mmetsp:Transcript_71412/g.187216  ORF Transcript_71412/g.187216 Transcript_71412/m.187216 type:complete len:216 (+) Transcript_71412:105-752(+)
MQSPVLRVGLAGRVLVVCQARTELLAEERLRELLGLSFPESLLGLLQLLLRLALHLRGAGLLGRPLGQGRLEQGHKILVARLVGQLRGSQAAGALDERVRPSLEKQPAERLQARRRGLHERRLPRHVRARGVGLPLLEHLVHEGLRALRVQGRQSHGREERRLADGILAVPGRGVAVEEDEHLLVAHLASLRVLRQGLRAPVQGRVAVLVVAVLQ